MKKFLLLSAFISLYQGVLAEKTLEPSNLYSFVKLEDSIISESNFETDVTSTPKNVTIITKEEFQEKGAKTVAEALKTVPGLVTKTMTGSEPVFDLRGQGDPAKSNVIVLRDGIPLNSIDSSGYKTSNIPLEQIERIEVIPGGGAVLYGDGAVAGIINIISSKPENKKNYGSVGMEAGSYDLFKYSLNYGTAISEKLFLTLDYSEKMQKGYRDYSETNLTTFATNWLYLLDNGQIDFRFNYSKDDFKAPGSLSKSETDTDSEQSNPNYRLDADNESYTYNLKYSTNIANNLEFLNFLDYSTGDYASNNPYSSYASDYDYDTEKFYVKPHFKYDYSKKNNVIFGGDFLTANTDVTEGFSQGKREKDSAGTFIINRFYVNDFQFTQGYRYQETKIDYLSDDTNLHNDAIELSANYLYSNTGSIFFNYSNSFRTPNTDELAYWSGDVNSQTSNTFEIGTKDMIANTYYSLSTFLIYTDDEIVYAEDQSGNPYNFNLDGETERRGIEFFLEHYFKKLTLRETFTYTQADITSGAYDGNQMPGIPEYKVTLGGTYAFTESLKFNTDINYLSETYDTTDFNNNYGKDNDFITVDTNLNYSYDETLSIYGGINNLFDKEYYDYVGGYEDWSGNYNKFYYPANGRNFYVGFRKSF